MVPNTETLRGVFVETRNIFDPDPTGRLILTELRKSLHRSYLCFDNNSIPFTPTPAYYATCCCKRERQKRANTAADVILWGRREVVAAV